MTKSIAAAAALLTSFGGWTSALASECSACDQAISVSQAALKCLSQRMDDLVEDARDRNPLLVNLAECPSNQSSDGERGEARIPKAQGISKGEDSGEEDNTSSPSKANYVILSLGQLECLEKNLGTMLASGQDSVGFDFQGCSGT